MHYHQYMLYIMSVWLAQLVEAPTPATLCSVHSRSVKEVDILGQIAPLRFNPPEVSKLSGSL